MKNGIVNEQKQSPTAKLTALVTSGEAGKVAVPNPGSRAVEKSSECILTFNYGAYSLKHNICNDFGQDCIEVLIG